MIVNVSLELSSRCQYGAGPERAATDAGHAMISEGEMGHSAALKYHQTGEVFGI